MKNVDIYWICIILYIIYTYYIMTSMVNNEFYLNGYDLVAVIKSEK